MDSVGGTHVRETAAVQLDVGAVEPEHVGLEAEVVQEDAFRLHKRDLPDTNFKGRLRRGLVIRFLLRWQSLPSGQIARL